MQPLVVRLCIGDDATIFDVAFQVSPESKRFPGIRVFLGSVLTHLDVLLNQVHAVGSLDHFSVASSLPGWLQLWVGVPIGDALAVLGRAQHDAGNADAARAEPCDVLLDDFLILGDERIGSGCFSVFNVVDDCDGWSLVTIVGAADRSVNAERGNDLASAYWLAVLRPVCRQLPSFNLREYEVIGS